MPILFNRKKSRYELNGKAITPAQIRREIEKLRRYVEREMQDAGEQLAVDEISKAEWNERMKAQIKTALIVAAAIGFGGRRAMTAKQWGAVGAQAARQYKYLARLFNEIDNGRVSGVRIVRRSKAYANAVHSTFYKFESEMRRENFEYCRRVIHSKEGCSECAEVADLGFIPIDEMPELDTLICGVFCLCELEYA